MRRDKMMAWLGLVLLVPALVLVAGGLMELAVPRILVQPPFVIGGLLAALAFNAVQAFRIRFGREADALVGTISLRLRGTTLNLVAVGIGALLLGMIAVYVFLENFQPRLVG